MFGCLASYCLGFCCILRLCLCRIHVMCPCPYFIGYNARLLDSTYCQ